MATLKSGTLAKLLEKMNADEKGFEDGGKPVLLQIRSIIPMLEGGDLWPNRGFYLKVSDLSHAMYVKLPHEQDEMILTNALQLGQFIYVHKLRASHPVPLLRCVIPVPGKHRCDGTPEDIAPMNNLVRFLQPSDSEPVKDKGVISEKKILLTRGLSDSESSLGNGIDDDDGEERSRGKLRSLTASRAASCEEIRGLNCFTKTSVDEKRDPYENDTDSDSPKSSVLLRPISKRRSWNESELLDLKQIFAREETRPKSRSRSVCVSPARSLRYDSSDENSTSTRRRVTGSTSKSVKSSNRRTTIIPKIISEENSHPEAMCSIVDDTKGAENRISWESLPSSLAKLGKDMVRHKDVALLAAIEALQEACAAEKLIKCLSTYSELHSYKGDDPQQFFDRFFNLQADLTQTKLVVQSLTNISPLRTLDTDVNSIGSVKQVLDLAVQRKKKATSWIKSAMAFDLAPAWTSSLRNTTSNTHAANTLKKSSSTTTSRITKPKGSCITRKQGDSEVTVGMIADKDDPLDWVKGGTFSSAADLVNALQVESQRSFLNYAEKFVVWVESKTSMIDSDSGIAGMMYQIKKVSDWLDIVSKEANSEKNGSRESLTFEGSEVEACGRVRNKIYEVLLKHAERTALALEKMTAAG